jgi:hypothetical protein
MRLFQCLSAAAGGGEFEAKAAGGALPLWPPLRND